MAWRGATLMSALVLIFTGCFLIVSHKAVTKRYMKTTCADSLTIKPGISTLKLDDTSIADELFDDVTVLCWILTYPENHYSKAVHTGQTWGKRCNKFLYMSDAPDDTIGIIGLNVTPGRRHLASKSREALDYIYKHHIDDADWFLKADDDTYVIMENLRFLLQDEDPDEAIFFGKNFRHSKMESYFAGGAGYVMSREALIKFATRPPGKCAVDTFDGSNEDVRISGCLNTLGTKFGDSTDSMGRYRFHHFSPDMHLFGIFPKWYPSRSSLKPASGLGHLSTSPITFHKVEPQMMYLMEYFVYHLRPYGITFGLDRKQSDAEVEFPFISAEFLDIITEDGSNVLEEEMAQSADEEQGTHPVD